MLIKTGRVFFPNRPQAKITTSTGKRYFAQVRRQAAAEFAGHPVIDRGFVKVQLELYYALPADADDVPLDTPVSWSESNIPRSDTASYVLLSALNGFLYTSVQQVQPLIISRDVLRSEALERLFGPGAKRGCAVVTYEEVS